MKKKDIFLAVLYLVLSVIPILLGLDAIAVILVSALLTCDYVIFGAALWGAGGVLAFALVFAVGGFNIIHAAVFMALSLPVSFFMGRGFVKKQSFSYVMTSSATVCIAVSALSVVYFMRKFSTSALNVLIGESVQVFKNAIEQSGADASVINYFDTMFEQFEIMLPSVMVISVCICVYAAFGLARGMLAKKDMKYPEMPVFSELRLSRGFTTVFLIISLLSLVVGINAVTLNILTVVTMMFTVCGLSFCDYFLISKNVGRFLRMVIYVAVFIISLLTGTGTTLVSTALFLIGVVDSFKPLRKRDIEVL